VQYVSPKLQGLKRSRRTVDPSTMSLRPSAAKPQAGSQHYDKFKFRVRGVCNGALKGGLMFSSS
jgi:hypothetical protein